MTVLRSGRIASRAHGVPPTALDTAVREGPARILGLALQGTYCLHASAVAIDGDVVALAGSSGVGKSTLAALLADEGWPRIADDIVPVRLTAGEARTSWAAVGDRHARTDGAAMRLRAVCLLGASETIALRHLTGTAAATALVRHSVAARLFGADLLARHLAWSADLAGCVAVARLDYPRRLDVAPQIARVLRRV